jgi:hypothetical protein
MFLFRKEYRLRGADCQGVWQNGFSLAFSGVVMVYSLWNIMCKKAYNNVINMLIHKTKSGEKKCPKKDLKP